MKSRLPKSEVLAELVEKFNLESLRPTLQACEVIADECPIDVAVIGQFKSGKSSLLNTMLREALSSCRFVSPQKRQAARRGSGSV